MRDIPVSIKTACAWDLYHRTNGFLRWGGEIIEFMFEELNGLEVKVGLGSTIKELNTNLTTNDIQLNTWYKMEIIEWAFIAVYPKEGHSTNYLKLHYRQ